MPILLTNDKTIDTTYLRSAISIVETRQARLDYCHRALRRVGMIHFLVGPSIRTKDSMDGMSPKRIDPDHIEPAFEEIPKIARSLEQRSIDSASRLYGHAFANLLLVSLLEVA